MWRKYRYIVVLATIRNRVIRTNLKGWPDALFMATSGGDHGQLWFWPSHLESHVHSELINDNKPVALLSTACSLIDSSKSLFVNRWHANGTIEIPSSLVISALP
jgi:hypothetical protein